MNSYPNRIKKKLLSIIREMSKTPALFVKSPGKDFTRDRKLPFEAVMHTLISMGGNSLYAELLETRGYNADIATTSAFSQQRDKLLPYAFDFLLHEFTHSYPGSKKYKGYRLLAVDGSDLLVPTNPDDIETYITTNPNGKGHNRMYLNALYDLLNRLYVDSIVYPIRQANYHNALVDMVGRSKITDKVILIGDRAYGSYNNFAHIEMKGWNYIIRLIDGVKNCIPQGLKLPVDGEYDISVKRILTRKRNKMTNAQPDLYRYIGIDRVFDFFDSETLFFPISFRVARFKISDDTYETVITNLDMSEFSTQELKELYRLRWGIETSFRELKYAVGLNNFHSKKRGHIIQEVLARIIMHNFAEIITSHVVISQANTKFLYQVNFTVAIRVCRKFLRAWINAPPFDVEALIRKNVLPVRPNRKDERKIRSKSAVSFLYKVA